MSDQPTLEYATPQGQPPRDAQFGLMFRYFTPVGLFLTAILTWWFIESSFPNGDSRNIGSPCCAVVMGPAALFYVYPAVKEALLPKGRRVLLQAMAFWLTVPLLFWAALVAIVKFGLFKHGW